MSPLTTRYFHMSSSPVIPAHYVVRNWIIPNEMSRSSTFKALLRIIVSLLGMLWSGFIIFIASDTSIISPSILRPLIIMSLHFVYIFTVRRFLHSRCLFLCTVIHGPHLHCLIQVQVFFSQHPLLQLQVRARWYELVTKLRSEFFGTKFALGGLTPSMQANLCFWGHIPIEKFTYRHLLDTRVTGGV